MASEESPHRNNRIEARSTTHPPPTHSIPAGSPEGHKDKPHSDPTLTETTCTNTIHTICPHRTTWTRGTTPTRSGPSINSPHTQECRQGLSGLMELTHILSRIQTREDLGRERPGGCTSRPLPTGGVPLSLPLGPILQARAMPRPLNLMVRLPPLLIICLIWALSPPPNLRPALVKGGSGPTLFGMTRRLSV